MGVFACLLFGIITAWFLSSILPTWRPKNLMLLLMAGVLGGLTGCMGGKSLGFADMDKFNLYSLGMGILAVVVMTFMASRISPRPQAELVAELEEEY